MAYAHSKLIGAPLPLVSGEMGLLTNRPVMIATKTRVVPLQMRKQQEQNLQAPESFSISRRDAMLYMTVEILSFLSAEPAEARVGKLERKKKIMKKLEKLREEAGVSKPKSANGIMPPTPAPPMNRKQGSVGPVMEAILPYEF